MSGAGIARTTTSVSLIAAPLLGLAAAVATPALRSTRQAEIQSIAAHQNAFYVYAICILLSSYLLVPAIFGVMNRLPDRNPAWAYVGGGLVQVSMLIAIGDAATELLYWQTGARGADLAQMAALADRYENAAGASLIYSIGGLCGLVGSVLLVAGLIRRRSVPAWAALAIPVGFVANVAGFAAASKPLLIVSYVILLAAFVRIATLPATARVERATEIALAAAGALGPQPRV